MGAEKLRLLLMLHVYFSVRMVHALGDQGNLTIALDRKIYSAVEGDAVQFCVTYTTGNVPSVQFVQFHFSSPISKQLEITCIIVKK